MATAYYTYGIQYPIIIKHNLDYWDYDWPFMDKVDIIYLFPEED